ncbi:hypothetical protein [Bacillus sp. FJAT-22090]|uniref:hypothetical protein n=1 Tax=Bacillus sp. FJAT-22090 TaxID=1581038 RepID=UPI0011A35DAA|nr:hypothetical protein [Bacillus sp. FJAT-22090]
MVNSGFCHLFKMQENELLGKSILHTHPELGLKEVLFTGVKLTNSTKLIGDTQCLLTILSINMMNIIEGCLISKKLLKRQPPYFISMALDFINE